MKVDQEQGYSPVKNYNKMLSLKEKVESILPTINQLDRDKIKSYFPLVDDKALIQLFKDIYNVWAIKPYSNSIYLVSVKITL